MGAPKLGVCKRGHLRTPENVSNNRQCVACHREYSKDWARNNPEKTRGYVDLHRKSIRGKDRRLGKNGWTSAMVEEALVAQNTCCALCGGAFTGLDKPYADHKHVIPPMPRGLLHRSCNFALGLLQDSPERCELAAAYLRKFNAPATPAA